VGEEEGSMIGCGWLWLWLWLWGGGLEEGVEGIEGILVIGNGGL